MVASTLLCAGGKIVKPSNIASRSASVTLLLKVMVYGELLEPFPLKLHSPLLVGAVTTQLVGISNSTCVMTSVPVVVSVTLTFCRKATAVSSLVETSPAATSPATGVTCRFK